MTTIAQCTTAYNTLQTNLTGLLNTAIDVLNPDKKNTPQIIALINDTQNQLTILFNATVVRAQALGVT